MLVLFRFARFQALVKHFIDFGERCDSVRIYPLLCKHQFYIVVLLSLLQQPCFSQFSLPFFTYIGDIVKYRILYTPTVHSACKEVTNRGLSHSNSSGYLFLCAVW